MTDKKEPRRWWISTYSYNGITTHSLHHENPGERDGLKITEVVEVLKPKKKKVKTYAYLVRESVNHKWTLKYDSSPDVESYVLLQRITGIDLEYEVDE